MCFSLSGGSSSEKFIVLKTLGVSLATARTEKANPPIDAGHLRPRRIE